MNGRTHMAFALALASPLIKGASGAGLMLRIGSCIVGSTLPDCDLLDNQSASVFEEAVQIVKHSAAPMVIFAYMNGIDWFTKMSMIDKQMLGLWFIMMVATMASPHRGWAHTIEWMAAFGFLWFRLTGSVNLTKFFLIGFGSHLLVDLLNKKPERMTIFVKKGFCFDLCKADGYISRLVELASIAYIVLQFKDLVRL